MCVLLLHVVIQSLGESQIELGSAIVPPPHHPLEVSHDQSHDPNLLVSQDGDINDVVIDDIVGRDSSPEDEEGTCLYTLPAERISDFVNLFVHDAESFLCVIL